MSLDETGLRAGQGLLQVTTGTVDIDQRLRDLPGMRRRRARARVAGTVAALALVVAVGVGVGLRATTGPVQGGLLDDSGPAIPSPTSAPLMPRPADADLPARVAAQLQRTLDEWVAGDNGVGVTAAVVTSEGTWQGAAGVDATNEALVAESAMPITGITSTFLAAEVMGLVGRGVIDLDAPISDYATLPFDADGATVRQVLGMRSGFPVDPIEQVLESAGQDLDRTWPPGHYLRAADADGPRQGTRGDLYYSNLNAAALSQLVEEVTGTSVARALRRDLMEPAGLERAWVQDAEAPVAPLAVGVEDSDAKEVDPAGPWLPSRSVASALGPAGAMAGDAPTMATWGYLLYGGHVIDPALVAQMTEGTPDNWYGLGTVRVAEDEGSVNVDTPISPDGGVAVGHDGQLGSAGSILFVWPHRGLSIAVMTPQQPPVPLVVGTTLDGLLERLRRAVRGE
jgi:D-alanyl-D-alanine carboxypeptidase